MLLSFTAWAMAAPSAHNVPLDSDNIASSALRVAEATHTSGYCYGAVCRALVPLSINLHGSAAYEAKALLLKDNRFVPLTINSVDALRRGDIIVYDRSTGHPYGHISVYEGDYTEASDHVSAVTHTQAYGGATVFRLRTEIARGNGAIASGDSYGSGWREPSLRNYESGASPQASPFLSHRETILDQTERRYYSMAKQRVKSALVSRCVQFLMGGR